MVKSKSSMSSRAAGEGFDPIRMTGDPSLGFSSDERFTEAVHDYWSDTSSYFRHPQNEQMRQAAVAFDAELEKMSFNDSIYRGVSLSPERLAELEVGAMIDQGGPASWSKSKGTAENFAEINHDSYGGKRVVFVMHSGTKHGGDISNRAKFKYEEEVATSSKSTQEILKRRTKSGIIYIDVQEV